MLKVFNEFTESSHNVNLQFIDEISNVKLIIGSNSLKVDNTKKIIIRVY